MLPAKPVNPAVPVTALRTVVLTALLFASLLGAGCTTAPKAGATPRFMTSEREPTTRERLGRPAMASDLVLVRSNLGERPDHRSSERQDELVRAAAAADVKGIKTWLVAGASPNTASADGRRPVAAAVS